MSEISAKKKRKIERLTQQIEKFYGPLYFLILQSEKLFELNRSFHEAYSSEYIGTNWSTDERTTRILEGETKQTLDVANKYMGIVQSNNHKIKKILDENYPFIDRDDIEVFLLFYEHYIRLTTERDDEGRIITPRRIYKRIGSISLLPPKVIERVKEKFLSKKKELDELMIENWLFHYVSKIGVKLGLKRYKDKKRTGLQKET
jgi:hypothetical protein